MHIRLARVVASNISSLRSLIFESTPKGKQYSILFLIYYLGLKSGQKGYKDCFILGIWRGNLMPNLIPNIWIAGKAQIWARVLNSIVISYSQTALEILLGTFLDIYSDFDPRTPILALLLNLYQNAKNFVKFSLRKVRSTVSIIQQYKLIRRKITKQYAIVILRHIRISRY